MGEEHFENSKRLLLELDPDALLAQLTRAHVDLERAES